MNAPVASLKATHATTKALGFGTELLLGDTGPNRWVIFYGHNPEDPAERSGSLSSWFPDGPSGDRPRLASVPLRFSVFAAVP